MPDNDIALKAIMAVAGTVVIASADARVSEKMVEELRTTVQDALAYAAKMDGLVWERAGIKFAERMITYVNDGYNKAARDNIRAAEDQVREHEAEAATLREKLEGR